MIERSGEIVLGTETIDQLHVHIGDTVRSTAGPLRVVGTATFPTIGVVHGDHTSLGVGGIVVPAQVPGYDRNLASPDSPSIVQTAADDYGPNVLFVRFRPGVDERAAVEAAPARHRRDRRLQRARGRAGAAIGRDRQRRQRQQLLGPARRRGRDRGTGIAGARADLGACAAAAGSSRC